MKKVKVVSLSTKIKGFFIQTQQSNHFCNGGLEFTLTRNDCSNVRFIWKIGPITSLSLEYEVDKNFIVIYSLKKNEKFGFVRDKQCSIIPLNFINRIVECVKSYASQIPKEIKAVFCLEIEPDRIRHRVYCNNGFDDYLSSFSLSPDDERGRNISSCVFNIDGEKVIPEIDLFISLFDKKIKQEIENFSLDRKRKLKAKEERESYVHTEKDEKMFLFATEKEGGHSEHIAITENGQVFSYGGGFGVKEDIEHMKEFIYKYNWEYRIIIAEKGDPQFINALTKMKGGEDNSLKMRLLRIAS